MQIQVLGPIRIVDEGSTGPLGGPRQQTVLAVLVALANTVVSTDRLIDEIWGENPPPAAKNSLQSMISNLRGLLEGDDEISIDREGPGYVLRIASDGSDALEFVSAVDEIRGLLVADPDTAAAKLGAALAMWRGAPYAGLADEVPVLQADVVRLENLRLRAVAYRIEAELAVGHHGELVGELETLIDANPFNEEFTRLQMLALYRTGRQSEALRVHSRLRRTLGDELGIEPSPDLKQLEQRILEQDASLLVPSDAKSERIDSPNPYKGLLPFRENDAEDFFGRDELIAEIVHQIGDSGPGGFTAIVGPSGCGKSSLVNAGVVPLLRTGGVPNSDRWVICRMYPGTHPLEELEAALLKAAPHIPSTLTDVLADEVSGLSRAARLVLPHEESQLLLIIDQFEELFVLTPRNNRERFIRQLIEGLSGERTPLRLLITLRSDFLGQVLRRPRIADLMRDGTLLIPPMGAAELEEAIVGPAQRVRVSVEPGLLLEVISDLVHQPVVLPLLQYALMETFQQRMTQTLTADDYRATGGVAGALTRRAEELYERLDDPARRAARRVFLALVALGEGAEDTRRRVPHTELAADGIDRRSVEQVLDAFGRHRLLSFDRNPVTGNPTVELAHESLLREWPRLRRWVEVSRDAIGVQRRVTQAAKDWEEAERDESFLASGMRLIQFVAVGADDGVIPGTTEVEFLAASSHLERIRTRRTRQRRRRILAAIAGVAMLALLAALLALVSRTDARYQARLAGVRELARASVGNLSVDPELSVLLALEAVRREPLPEAVEALHRAVAESRVALSLPTAGGGDVDPAGRIATTDVDGRILIWNGATGEVVGHLDAEPWEPPEPRRLARASVLFSPDGEYIAAAAIDGTVRMLDASTGDELWRHEAGHVDATSGEATGIRDMAFSADGNRFVTLGGSIDLSQLATVRVWDSWSGGSLTRFQASPGGVLLGGSGEVVVASDRGGLSSWNAVSGEPIVVSNPNTGVRHGEATARLGVLDIATPPSGAPLAIARNDGDLRFGAVDSEPIMGGGTGLLAHVAQITATAFSPDGALLVTAGRNGVVKVWSVRTGDELVRLVGHVGEVERVAFLAGCLRSLQGSLQLPQEGCTLLTAGRDGSVRLWDVSRTWNQEWRTLLLDTLDVTDVVFTPDGMHLVTSALSQASITKVTDPASAPQGFGVAGRSIAVSTGGDLAATAGLTGVLLFSLPDGEITPYDPLPVLGAFVAVDFDPMALRLAAAAKDGTVYLWDWSAGTAVQLTEIGIGARDIAFSTDGSSLVAAADDGTARVIDVGNGDVRFELAGHTGTIEAVLYSSDGRWIFTGDSDGLAQVWSSETGALERTMQGHTAGITGLSTDGATLATASVDGTAKLWDLESGEPLLTLGGGSGLTGVAFSPEGRFLATSASDGTVSVYVIPVEDLVELAQQRVTRSLTETECQQYLHVEHCRLP